MVALSKSGKINEIPMQACRRFFNNFSPTPAARNASALSALFCATRHININTNNT